LQNQGASAYIPPESFGGRKEKNTMFSKLNLWAKVLLALLPIFFVTVVIILYLNHSVQQRTALKHAKDVATTQALTIKESIVEMMTINEELDDAYLERIRNLGDVHELELWTDVDRLNLRPELLTSERLERLHRRGKLSRLSDGSQAASVLSEGRPRWSIVCSTGEHPTRQVDMTREAENVSFSTCDSFEALMPVVAEEKCQKCHAVGDGYVLSILHMQIPMTRSARVLQASDERSVVIFALFAFAAVGTGVIVFRRYVSGPLRLLVRGTEMIGQGRLDQPISHRFSGDELGRLAASFDRMVNRLREARDELVRKERLSVIGQTASAVAHDLRGPLTTITLSIDMLENDGIANPDSLRSLNRIRETVSRMNGMVQELLDFSRGSTRFEPENQVVDEFLARTLDVVKATALSAGVELKNDWHSGAAAVFDGELMQRALTNLLVNAIEATPRGGSVTMRCRYGSRFLLFEVRDTGTGIPEAAMVRLFEPFVTAGKEKGTGLGLAITKRIVEQHGGTITLATTKGKGTTFTVTLPCAVLAGVTEASVGPVEPENHPEVTDRRS